MHVTSPLVYVCMAVTVVSMVTDVRFPARAASLVTIWVFAFRVQPGSLDLIVSPTVRIVGYLPLPQAHVMWSLGPVCLGVNPVSMVAIAAVHVATTVKTAVAQSPAYVMTAVSQVSMATAVKVRVKNAIHVMDPEVVFGVLREGLARNAGLVVPIVERMHPLQKHVTRLQASVYTDVITVTMATVVIQPVTASV